MNIIYITPECYPFTQGSSLSDLVSTLAHETEKLGNNIKVFIPRYGFIDPSVLYIERIPFDFRINFSSTEKENPVIASVYKGILPDSLCSIYFIESQGYFSNSKEIHLEGPADNERFRFFCQASLDIISRLKMDADLFHLFSPHEINCATLIRSGKIISTLSNLDKNPSRNYIQSLANSDLVVTVSESLLDELLSGSCSRELAETLKHKRGNLLSITSGINQDMFNPETDSSIAQAYSKSYFTVGKKKCKESLLEIFDLSENPQLPVIGIILGQNPSVDETSLLHDLFLQASDNVNIKLISTVPANIKNLTELAKIAERNKNIKICHSYNHESIKKLLAGSDFYINLNPKEYDGYYVLISLRYGSVPIAFKAGIINEIITDIKNNESGNGFLFDNYNIKDLSEALSWGLGFYKIKERWTKSVKEAMGGNLTKQDTVKEYIKCYERLLGKSLVSASSKMVI